MMRKHVLINLASLLQVPASFFDLDSTNDDRAQDTLYSVMDKEIDCNNSRQYTFFSPTIDIPSLLCLRRFHLVVSDEMLVADGSINALKRIIDDYDGIMALVVDLKQGVVLL